MSAEDRTPSAAVSDARPRDGQLAVLTRTVVFAVAIALLWWARGLLIPIAMAIFLAFVLTPLVVRLQRLGLGKAPAVLIVVALAGGLFLGTLWLSARQLTSLAAELPNYSSVLRDKVRSARAALSSGTVERLQNLFQGLSQEWREAQNLPGGAKAGASASPAGPGIEEVDSGVGAWTSYLQGMAGPFLGLVGQASLASILVVFILLKREDLRDRLILLIGHTRLTVTTKAIDEAGQRISRFLLMQVTVNGAYGLALSAGLWMFGLPYALLWGFLAATLRYIPYAGPWAAALMPVTLAVAVFPGWWTSLGIVALIALLELVSNNVVEPLLYGRSVGLSPTAVLMSAAVWGFLWGPVGMVLSTPIAVCLVVLGKHVPALRVLQILLSDETALDPRWRWYQRALAQDDDEAAEIVADELRSSSPLAVIDGLLLPALAQANADLRGGLIDPRDYAGVLQAVSAASAELGDAEQAADSGSPNGRPLVMACVARDSAEAAALSLLATRLRRDKWNWETASHELLASELAARVEERRPAVIVVSSLPPGRGLHARYLCKRLAPHVGQGKLLVARWADADAPKQALLEAGAHEIATSLAEALEALARWRILIGPPEEAGASEAG